MKKSLLLIPSFIFMISCGQENYWNEKNKTDFKTACELSLNRSLEQSEVNIMDQLGTTVVALCDCQLDKTMARYPDAAPNANEIKQTTNQMATDCISELRK
ncbi:MAG: hypothetical protein ACTIJ9_11075 [Aequorivita sp.]